MSDHEVHVVALLFEETRDGRTLLEPIAGSWEWTVPITRQREGDPRGVAPLEVVGAAAVQREGDRLIARVPPGIVKEGDVLTVAVVGGTRDDELCVRDYWPAGLHVGDAEAWPWETPPS